MISASYPIPRIPTPHSLKSHISSFVPNPTPLPTIFQLYCTTPSAMSFQNLQHIKPEVLNKQQALIPQQFKKTLESRALLDHYQQAKMRKLYSERESVNQRIQEMELSKVQTERHMRELERRRMTKQYNKNEYSREYESMIEMKKEKDRYEKEQQLWLERRMLNEENWLTDVSQQKEIEKVKKMQYGKQLEMHLRLQEEKRITEANRIKDIRDQLKRESQEIARKEQEQEMKYKRRSMFEKRQTDIPSVKDALNWSHTTQDLSQSISKEMLPISPRMDHMLKLQRQKHFGKGIQAQYKSQNQRKYFQKQNPQHKLPSMDQKLAYNPITNPIPYKYKNPNILKLLSDYS